MFLGMPWFFWVCVGVAFLYLGLTLEVAYGKRDDAPWKDRFGDD